MDLNISMKDAQTRHNNKLCLNCGQSRTNSELESCNKLACRRVLKPLFHWAVRVAEGLTGTTYVGKV